jgi:nitrate reductase gamma subunit
MPSTESVLTFARGPALYFAFAVFFLGMLRQVGLTVAELVRAYGRAGNQVIPYRLLFRQSLGWIIPVNGLRGARVFYTVASVAFHVGMLLVTLFLSGHVQLIEKGMGIAWPTLQPAVADVLTITTLAALAVLLLFRLGSRALRFLSTLQDWFLLVLCVVPILSGYYVSHPAGNPLPFWLTYLIHLLSAELLVILIPFTKLAHVVLFPFTRISWELGWHFVPGAGEKVRIALGKRDEPV